MPALTKLWTGLALGLAVPLLMMGLGCSPDPVTIEVTREVSVTREVPVTVETAKTIEVTRVVEREILVTTEVVRTAEVTRAPTTRQTVEVTREVPVTRLVVVTPTPAPTAPAIDNQSSPNAVPTPTPPNDPTGTPSPDPTVTASSSASGTPAERFGMWEMASDRHQYGDRTTIRFHNVAAEWEGAPEPPVATFQCDSRGGRSLYIDWGIQLTTTVAEVSRYIDDPFEEYRDDDLDALADLALHLLDFMETAKDYAVYETKRNQVWAQLERSRQLDENSAVDLVDRIRRRNHRSVLIDLAFYLEKADVETRSKYGSAPNEEESSTWLVVAGERTYAQPGTVGILKRAYGPSYDSLVGYKLLHTMTVAVRSPEQPSGLIAKWDIGGLPQAMGRCLALR